MAPWLGRALTAGAVGGLAMGAGLRLAMRLAAVTEGQETVFTPGGTLFLLVAGGSFGLLLGPLYGAVRRWVPGRGTGRGAVFGMVLAVLAGVLLFSDSDSEARVIGAASVNVLSFGLSFTAWGVVAEWSWARLDRWPSAGRAASGAAAGSLAGAATGLVVTAVALGRWTATTSHGVLSLVGSLAGGVLLGLLFGGAFGLGYGLLRTRRAYGPGILALLLVGAWLLLAVSAREEGPMGSPHAAEIVVGVSGALALFAALTSGITRGLEERLRPAVAAEDRT